jgi:hypothetical protein
LSRAITLRAVDISEDRQVRPARVLIGWLDADEAILALAGMRDEDKGNPDYERRVRQARTVAGARRPAIGVEGVVTEAPASLASYKAVFGSNPSGARFLAEGWRIALVDLRRVCAVQPTIFTDVELPDVDPDDLESIARVTLRLPSPQQFRARYDDANRTWTVPVESPNLRISRQFQTELEPGEIGFGFAVRLSSSYLRVARLRDRYLMRDGYHRALALLGRGINVVPALVGEFVTPRELQLGRGMLPSEIWTGSRPPLLPDFLDDDVSAAVLLPARRRVIVIQGLDLTVFDE